MDKIIKKHLDRKFLEALNRISNGERCGATPKKLFQKTRDGGLMNSKNSLQKPKKGLATPELDWPPPSHAPKWSLLEPSKVLAALRISIKKEESCQNAINIRSKNCPS